MHVVVQLIVTLVSKLDLLEVDLDANITHVDIFQAKVLLQAVRALVSDVSERIEKFLCPVLE